MRKALWILMSALVVLGCNTKSSSKGDDDEEEVKEVKTKVFKYEKNTSHGEASIYCEFPVGGDEELGDSIYQFIVETMVEQQAFEEELDDYRNDGQAFVDLFGKKISNDLEEGWQSYTGGDETMGDVLYENIKYSIVEDNDQYVTCLYEYDNYYGGDGYMNKEGCTFLKSDASRVTNEFLFENPESQKLLNLITKTLTEKYCRGDNAFLGEEELEHIDTLPRNPFYLTADGIAFCYAAYEVHWSFLEAVIPYDKVKDLLTDEAQELFEP